MEEGREREKREERMKGKKDTNMTVNDFRDHAISDHAFEALLSDHVSWTMRFRPCFSEPSSQTELFE